MLLKELLWRQITLVQFVIGVIQYVFCDEIQQEQQLPGHILAAGADIFQFGCIRPALLDHPLDQGVLPAPAAGGHVQGQIGLGSLLDGISLLARVRSGQHLEETVKVVPGPLVQGTEGIQILLIQANKFLVIMHTGESGDDLLRIGKRAFPRHRAIRAAGIGERGV